MKKKPQFTDRESRFLHASVELRQAQNEDEKSSRIFGYASKFNLESEKLRAKDERGGIFEFREVIANGAFDDVLNDDVRALFNHESELILARSKNGEGSLKIGVDNVGLWYEFEAPDTQAGRDLVTSMRRGDVDQSSFTFKVAEGGDKWEKLEDGTLRRTIFKIAKLLDVSPVTYPAYVDTTAAMRSLEEFQHSEPEKREEETEDNSLSHWQRRMGLIDKPASNQQ